MTDAVETMSLTHVLTHTGTRWHKPVSDGSVIEKNLGSFKTFWNWLGQVFMSTYWDFLNWTNAHRSTLVVPMGDLCSRRGGLVYLFLLAADFRCRILPNGDRISVFCREWEWRFPLQWMYYRYRGKQRWNMGIYGYRLGSRMRIGRWLRWRGIKWDFGAVAVHFNTRNGADGLQKHQGALR